MMSQNNTYNTILLDNDVFEENSEVGQRICRYSKFNPKIIKKPKYGSKANSELNVASVANHRKAVLVTDDNYSNRMVIIEMLKRFNVIGIEAVNGEDAANIVKNSFNRNSNFDIELILMDLNMPIMSGVESTQKIRQLEKEYKRVIIIPIVAITAHKTTTDQKACYKAGMQDYFLKPVSSKMLKEIIEKYATNLISKAST